MKSLVINAALGLAWCLALTSVGLAQDVNPFNDAQKKSDVWKKTVPAVPVADAKQRYHEAKQHLEQLSTGNWEQLWERRLEPVRVEFSDRQQPRDQLRAAVAEAFDARRQLQQSELAELERRIANIKRALQISDAMRETIIDQRTDELLDQIEERGKRGERGGSYPPGGGRPATASGKDGPATEPVDPNAASNNHRAELLALDVREAEANLEAAKRAYQRVEKLFKSGAAEQAVLDEQADKYNRAQLQVERAELELNAFIQAHERGAHAEPFADRDAAAADTRKRLAALDLKMAEANLAAAESRYERFKRHFADKAIDQAALDKQAAEYDRARIQLERAKARLNGLEGSSEIDADTSEARTADGTSSTDENRRAAAADIAWGPTNESAQLGWKIEPRKESYQPGDVLTVTLLLRNAGAQAMHLTIPRTQILEKLGCDLVLHEAPSGTKLPWRWGPAHREATEISGAFGTELAPGEVHQLPPFKLSIGDLVGGVGPANSLMAELSGATPGKTARLRFKLAKSYDAFQAAELESERFEFRVEERKAP